MSILDIFKRKKDTEKILQAGITLYPDKIVIETIHIVKEGFGISSTDISILAIDADNERLGSKVRHHLNRTKTGLQIPKDYKQHYKEFLDKAGFKNAKNHHKDALHLTIAETDENIIIHPTCNAGATGKERGFIEIKRAETKMKNNISSEELGDAVRTAWSKCKCI